MIAPGAIMNLQPELRSQYPLGTQYNNTMDLNDSDYLKNCLLAVAERRDKRAFSQVFSWFAPKIKGLAAKQYHNDSLALEILQETMTQVWRKAHLYNPDKGAVSTWVYTIMRNVSFDLLRKIKARPESTLSDDIWPMFEADQVEEEAFTDHLLDKKLLKFVDRLPDKQQQVIRGVFFQEMSQEQLANHLKIPLGTVKSRLRLAIAKLKQQMGEQDD